ncbi:putative late blight resistance protein homolog R1A-10 [Coffea eugenioides]|uniref:putative late blight resistance protein homolog R1A-10 n=1 Tax=Coffea eugenioides TaxID=49369 RepID=UPI000F613EE4|nr:putative late blight resistance protein homolog R1A-10 [Coffea eugenioides]
MAYVAITSLKQTLDQLKMNCKLEFTFDEVKQFKAVSEEISVIQEMLQDSADRSYDHTMMKHLERCIRDMAHKAEDFIEEFVYIKAEALDDAAIFEEELSLHHHMMEVLSDINSIKDMLSKIYQESDAAATKVPRARNHSVEHASGWSSTQEETLVVRIDNDLLKVKEKLTGLPHKLDILTIVGMGGIGKTTLARKVFNDPLIEYHFYVRAWVTVSQKYVLRDVLLGLLCSLTRLGDEIFKEKNEQLAELLYRTLKGQRYLIVFDAVWDGKILYDLRRSFPDDRNGSRIVLTSRLIDVNMCVNLDSHHHHMSFLSLNDSWELLRHKVFSEESCPPELEVIGKEIAQKCQGLPLGILAVAGHLSSIRKTKDCWKTVADDIRSPESKDQENCLDILALSYKSLPHHLKACFLYLGAFPQEFEIPVWRLIRLWAAEGILRAEWPKTLEEVAEMCLQELMSRSLVMVRKRKSNGGIKSCGIHDLVRDLILREVEKEDFLLVLKSDANFFPTDAYYKRCLCFHHQISRSYGMFNSSSRIEHCDYMKPAIPHCRSILFYGRLQVTEFDKMLDSRVTVMDLKLLTVLEILFRFFEHFPVEITQLVHLRNVTLPSDIWKMPRLRYLHIKNGACLPHPAGAKAIASNSLVLTNLHKLSTVSFTNCYRETFACLPNLKKLGICVMQPSHNCLDDLLYLAELEKLKCVFLGRGQFSGWNAFPPKLRKLTLNGSFLPWEKMRTLGLLPNLEVLKLKDYAFQGPEWQVEEDEFCQLKYLLIDGTDLVQWGVTCSHFQRLQQLILRCCRHLDEIPSEVGEIPTLQIIDVYDSSSLAVNSARLIQQEQYSMGNDGLIVRIHPRERD